MQLNTLVINDFIKINNVQQATSPFVLAADGNPDPDGIFSYDIFGRIGSEDRRLKFGYIDLKRKFLHPFIYNAIFQMYRNLPLIISGERWVKLDDKGVIIKSTPDDPEATTGIDFFIDNWERIKWDANGDSRSRQKKEAIFDTYTTDEIFVDKWLIIPAMYRDINLHDRSSKGRIDMDEINSLYIRLINHTSSESITFTSSFLTQSNVQMLLVDIHNDLTKKPAGKKGLIHSAIMGKTIDYAVVSVISAPRFNAEKAGQQQVPYNYIGIPLYIVCSLFYPLIIKNLEDIFHDVMHSTSIVLDSNVVDVDESVQDVLDSESLASLVKAYVKDKTKTIRTSRFTLSGDQAGRFEGFEKEMGRPFTVTDLLYRAAADVTFTRNVLSTRFPITDSASTIINKVKILTTERTVDISHNAPEGSFDFDYMRTYPFFPVDKNGEIVDDKVLWIDTVVPNNSVLAGMGGDFDGDTFRLIGLYTNDSNAEAERIQNAPMNYVDGTGGFMRGLSREAGLAIYMLTID